MNYSNSLTHLGTALHAGNVFYYSAVIELDSGNDMYMQIKTPSDKKVHLHWRIWSDTGSFETWLYEGASEQSDGNVVTPLNADRESSNTASSVMRSGVSQPASTGTTLHHVYAGKAGVSGWAGGTAAVGGSDNGEERVLAKNTNYIRKFTSNDNSNKINVLAYWMEEV